MANPEWGTKHSCSSCGAKYYDFKRSPILCPKCGTEHNPDAVLKSRRSRPEPAAKAAVAKPAASKKPAENLGDDTLVAELEDDEESDALIEDVSELGEDEDDMADVVVKEEEEES